MTRPEVDPAHLDAAYRRAAQQWPAVRVEAEVFGDRVRRTLGGSGDGGVELDRLSVEDLYLVCALERGDERAWELFRLHFRPCVLQALARLVRDAGEREEVADDVLTGLFMPRDGADGIALNTFTGRGGLKGWVQVTAVRRVYRRSRDRSREGWVQPIEDPPGPAEQNPGARAEREELLEALRSALPEAVAVLDDGERALLRLRYQRGFQLKELSRLYGQDKSTLSKRLKALSEKLKGLVLARLAAEQGAGITDLEGVWEALGRRRPEGLDTWLEEENPE